MPDLFSSSIRRQAEKPDRRISCPSSRLKTYPAIIANASPKKSARFALETICRVFAQCSLSSCLRHSSTICQVVDRTSRIFTLKRMSHDITSEYIKCSRDFTLKKDRFYSFPMLA